MRHVKMLGEPNKASVNASLSCAVDGDRWYDGTFGYRTGQIR